MFGGWFKKQKKCLGIDLGTSGMKIVELSRLKEQVFLSNYAMAQTKIGTPFNISKLEPEQLAWLLKNILDKAEISSKKAIISLPVNETFSTIIDIPSSIGEEELAQAIPYEARKYVPIPMEEVLLDWSVVGEISSGKKKEVAKNETGAASGVLPEGAKSQIKNQESQVSPEAESPKSIQVLIVAVPKEVIKKIAQVARIVDLEVLAVEQEAFSIVRALVTSHQQAYLIGDLGEESADLIVFDEGAIRITHTLEKIKPEELAAEITKIIVLYQNRYKRNISGVVLTGGKTTDSQWLGVLRSRLEVNVEIGDPFSRLGYDPKLKLALEEIKPFMSVAVGSAMREI